MRKLVILIEPPADDEIFGETWPQFWLWRRATGAAPRLTGNCLSIP